MADNLSALIAELRESEAKATPGKWQRIAQGGSSTVVAPVQPGRNDTRIPAYGYDPKNGHCIAYPALDCPRPEARLDFVSFSHEDAALIAAIRHRIKPMLAVVEAARQMRREHGALGSISGETLVQFDKALSAFTATAQEE